LIYEVNNTFGERHSYVFPFDRAKAATHHRCAKSLYVSPFIDMDFIYDFHVREPAANVALSIRGSDPGGPLIVASMAGRRHELTDAALARAFFAYPLLTLKVTVAIHWEALRLWLKGVRLTKRTSATAKFQIVRRSCSAEDAGQSHV
jgi:DUF1365 family protein